ncbi:hypothetical protein CK203_057577 [Vitis vinifera]|uniref:Uncharacterized protein n=1 Tax=Vitis vinifera TaxID=29760 RepID=A0A438GGY7_VITVI|nr:hypothetical protein CK203_057577 [Vitis vinifera]
MVVVFGFTCVVATTILPSSPLKQMVINFSKGSLKHHPAIQLKAFSNYKSIKGCEAAHWQCLQLWQSKFILIKIRVTLWQLNNFRHTQEHLSSDTNLLEIMISCPFFLEKIEQQEVLL